MGLTNDQWTPGVNGIKITHPFDELRTRLDYAKLRSYVKMMLYIRCNDSPYTMAKFVIKFTQYHSELGELIRNKKKLLREFIKQWVGELSDDEIFDMIKVSCDIDPGLTISEMASITGGRKNKKLFLNWAKANGIEVPIQELQSPVVWLTTIAAGPMFFLFLDSVGKAQWGRMALNIAGLYLCMVPGLRIIRSRAARCKKALMAYIDSHGEPDVLLIRDPRVWENG